MINNSKYSANRFREVILFGTWVANTNFKKELENLDWKFATKKMNSLNTIADLAQHIHYYINGINNVFKGGNLDIKDKFSFDFPEIINQEQWNIFLEKFWDNAEIFAKNVEKMSDQQLDAIFEKADYGTYFRNIDGMIEHSYYHLAQIVILKKLINL